MDTQSIRALILNRPLAEQNVTVDAWPGANLIIRELSANDGAALTNAATDASGKTNEMQLLADVVIATLRNGDDPDKALIFTPTDRGSLLGTGLGPLMEVAKASVSLSGLNEAAQVREAKNDSGQTPAAVSPSTSPQS